ncbi:hypothetical protein CN925_01320 [Bacillus sp. AFS055030]|nr:hypothetical protein CN925_01320 [Bacillus sp. AFS055030]
MKLARNILIIFSYIMFTLLIIFGPEFREYKLYVFLLQLLFFCTGPFLLIFLDWKKKRNKKGSKIFDNSE